MATAPFICDVEGSEKSLKTAVSSHQLRHRVCSYTRLQVLVGVLVVFVLALTGGIIWMKLFQETGSFCIYDSFFKDFPGKPWTVSFTGKNTNFISPRAQKYVIFGSVFTKEEQVCDKNSFKLYQKLNDKTSLDLGKKNKVAENFFQYDVKLLKEATLIIKLNCQNLTIDEDKSKLLIYQQDSF